MKAAIVVEAGQPPVYGEFPDPVAAPGRELVRVTASSVSQVTRARASGRHYSAKATLPFIPGIDGTGRTADGRRVYFLMPETPYGAMADSVVMDPSHCCPLPDDLGDEAAAAMAIPGMSSWAALVERAHFVTGETVLVNGATGTSGRLAIQIAKHLGAKKVIATGRNPKALDDLRALGADMVIPLMQERDALEAVCKGAFAERIDVVLDYLWGPSAETLIVAAAKASPDGVPVRFVQIGSIGGADIQMPGAALRSTALQLMGSGIGSVPFPRLLKAIESVLAAAPLAGFEVKTEAMPLADVTRAWAVAEGDARIVLKP